jgi:hypothetical protein
MRVIIMLTLAASLCLATGAQAGTRKAHPHRGSSSHASHTAEAPALTASAGHTGRRKAPAALDDSNAFSADAWNADSSFGGGKATHRATGTSSFGFDTASTHKKRGQTDPGNEMKLR